MKKICFIFIAVLIANLNSCAFFPGFAINKVNQITGTESGVWNHTDDFVSPTPTLSSPVNPNKIFDLDVSSRNGDVLLSYVGGTYIHVFLKSGNYPIADLSAALQSFSFAGNIVVGFDCSYTVDYDRPIVVVDANGSNTSVSLDINNWSTNFAYLNYGFNFDILENKSNAVGYLTTSNSLQYLSFYQDYTKSVETSFLVNLNGLIYANGNFDNQFNTGIGIAVADVSNLYLCHYDDANGWTKYTNLAAVKEYANPTNFRSIFMGPGDGNFTNYNFFEDNNGFAVLEKIWGNYNSPSSITRQLITVLSNGPQPVRGIDSCFDWKNRRLYMAYADNDGVVHVFEYYQGSGSTPILVGNEPSLNADRVKLRVRDGLLYLAVLKQDGHIELWNYQN